MPINPLRQTKWLNFRQELRILEGLRIPCWLGTVRTSVLQLHGFLASEKVYAACVYMTATDNHSHFQSNLVIAKSQVAPIKTISLPKLELCGTLLLSQLVVHTIKDLCNDSLVVFCWMDSQVILGWLNGAPNRWHTFVANRVSQILTLLPKGH